MAKITIKAYETVIQNDWYNEGATVLIGVAEEGHPIEAIWDSWEDNQIYFYITAQELADLKAGDILNDGEDFTIVEIDKDNPAIYEVEYNPADYEEITA